MTEDRATARAGELAKEEAECFCEIRDSRATIEGVVNSQGIWRDGDRGKWIKCSSFALLLSSLIASLKFYHSLSEMPTDRPQTPQSQAQRSREPIQVDIKSRTTTM